MADVLNIGTSFSHYRIQSKLGEGGMGEVYLAEDTKLFRKVALKILPEDIAAREDRLRRFEQEARAASALNHPNILTIYEVGDFEGLHFLATEYIDGRKLRDLMHGDELSLESLFDIAIQISAALSAAHEAGITHRDIKPENIMVRRDRLVKVLDFGLAKLGEGQPDVDTEAKTKAQVKTEPGVIMGTVNYMSPEQARGKETDSRTDTWSLGCVIYEMVAGESPFRGETTADRIAAIIHKDPVALTTLKPDAPIRLEEIVSKCLEKDRDERYQVVKDLLIDLRRLKKKLDLDNALDRSQAPNDINRTDAPSENRTQIISAAYSDTGRVEPTLSSAEYVVSGIKRHRLGLGAGLAAIALLAASAGAFIWYRSTLPPVKPKGEMQMTRVVSGLNGTPGNVTISPDGKFVAYSLIRDGQNSLWERQISQQNAVEIVKPELDTGYVGIVFSADRELVYFVSCNQKTDPTCSLYQMPVLGGREPKKLLSDISSNVSLSPDETQVAFIRVAVSKGETAAMIANVDGSGEARRVASRLGDDWFIAVAWSPDGNRLACTTGTVTGGTSYSIVEVPVAGGAERPVGSVTFEREVERINWLKDGSGLTVLTTIAANRQIAFVSYPDGLISRITNDLNNYGGGSTTSDGSIIAASLGEWSSKIWSSVRGEPEDRAKRLTDGRTEGGSGIAITADGKIVFAGLDGSTTNLSIMNADGTGVKKLASDDYSIQAPTVSPDGRHILFVSFRPDKIAHLWRIDPDGSNLTQLTKNEDYNPAITPDGKTVVFNSFQGGKNALWKASIDGGEPTKISNDTAYAPAVSPDGSMILCLYFDENSQPPKSRLALVSFDTGQLIRFLDLPPRAQLGSWSADGKEIIYIDTKGDVGNIWSQSLSGGEPKQLTKFTSGFLDRYAVSRDGKTILSVRSTGKNDIVLIKNFR